MLDYNATDQRSVNIFTEGISLLRAIKKRIVPQNFEATMLGTSLAVSGIINSQNLNLAQGKITSLIGTCLGNNAQISVWLNNANTGAAPDFLFISGVPSYQYFFPEVDLQYVIVQSTGSNPATFSLKLLNW